MIFSKLALLGVCFLFPCSMIWGQNDKLSVDKDHMVGVIEAHFANLESWRRGDFLIRIKDRNPGRLIQAVTDEDGNVRHNPVEGPEARSAISEMTRVHRVRFDFDQQRLFVANRVEQSMQIFDSLDREIGKPVVAADDRAVVINKGKGQGAARFEAALIRRLKPEEFSKIEDVLDQFAVPHIKTIGITRPVLWTGGYFERKFDQIRKQDEMVEISQVGTNRYQVFFRHDVVPQDRRRGLRMYQDWDVENNVPLKYAGYLGYNSGDHPAGDKPFQIASAEWKLIDGVYLPVSARYSVNATKTIDGHRFRFDEESTIDIHWFSINTDLPEELFDEEVLHDRKKLDELLDVSILEEKEGHSANSDQK